MGDDLLLRSISVLVQKYIGQNDATDWLILLCDHNILTKDQRKSLKQLALSGKEKEALYQSCQIILTTVHRTELLLKVFSNKDIPGDQRTADVIHKLVENEEISESFAWMICSWDKLEASKYLRDEATKLCPGISDDDWLLDFIHHILMTGNSHVVERFVKDANVLLENPEKDADIAFTTESGGSCEHMDVDIKKEDPENAAFLHSNVTDNPLQSFVDVSFRPLRFTTLNSDGKVKSLENKPIDEDLQRNQDMASEEDMIAQQALDRKVAAIEKKQTSNQTQGDVLDKQGPTKDTMDPGRKGPRSASVSETPEMSLSEGSKETDSLMERPKDSGEIKKLEDRAETGNVFGESKRSGHHKESVGELGPTSNEKQEPVPSNLVKNLSRSSSDASDVSECDGLDWFSSPIPDLRMYKYNIQLIVILAWPDELNLLDHKNWPYPLISFMQEHSNEDLVNTFIAACKRVIERCQPLASEYVREGKESKPWLRKNSELMIKHLDDLHLLFQLTWPSESVTEDGVLDALFAKLLKMKHKKQTNRLNAYVDAVRMLIEGKQKVDCLEMPQTTASRIKELPKTEKKANASASGTVAGIAAASKLKLKEILKIGKREKPGNSEADRMKSKSKIEVDKEPASKGGDDEKPVTMDSPSLNQHERRSHEDERSRSSSDLEGICGEDSNDKEKNKEPAFPIHDIPLKPSEPRSGKNHSSVPAQPRDLSPTRAQSFQSQIATTERKGEKTSEVVKKGMQLRSHTTNGVTMDSLALNQQERRSHEDERSRSSSDLEGIREEYSNDKEKNKELAFPIQHIPPKPFEPRSWENHSSVPAQHRDLSPTRAQSFQSQIATTERKGEKTSEVVKKGMQKQSHTTTSERQGACHSPTQHIPPQASKPNSGSCVGSSTPAQQPLVLSPTRTPLFFENADAEKRDEKMLDAEEDRQMRSFSPTKTPLHRARFVSSCRVDVNKMDDGDQKDCEDSALIQGMTPTQEIPTNNQIEGEVLVKQDLKKNEIDSVQKRSDSTLISDLTKSGKVSDRQKKTESCLEDEENQSTDTNQKHDPSPSSLNRNLSRSSSDGSTCAECEGLDWYSSSLPALKLHTHNIKLIARLAWPDQEKLFSDTNWLYLLKTFMDDHSNKELVETFITACKIVVEKCQPLASKYVKNAKEPKNWLQKNSKLLTKRKHDSHLLFQLGWPSEKVKEDKVVDTLLAKIQRMKKKKETNRMNAYIDAARMLMEGVQKVQPTDKHENTASKDKEVVITEKKISVSSSGSAASIAGAVRAARKSKIKDLLKFGKKEKQENSQSKRAESMRNAEVKKEPSSKGNQDKKSGNFPEQVTKPEVMKQGAEPTKFSKSKADIEQANDQGHPNAAEEFYDTVTNLEESIVLTHPATDHSFEVRVICNDYDPNNTTLCIVENLWHDWKPIRMNYNRERNYFFVVFPLPLEDFKFHYKYHVYLCGVTQDPIWERLPNSGSRFANHTIVLTEDITHIYDVPLFSNNYNGTCSELADLIKTHAHLHLPPVIKHRSTSIDEKEKGDISLKNEILSCVTQLKRGWKLTDTQHNTIMLNSEDFEMIILKWLTVSLAQTQSKEDVLNRILAVLNLAVVLHKLSHRIQEGIFLSVLCTCLSLHDLDEKHQKQLYQLIVQEFSTKDNGPCAVVCQALIGVYCQLPSIMSYSSHWMEWILTLPLFWIVMQAGNIKKKCSHSISRKNAGVLCMKAALPEADKLSWSDLQTKCKNTTGQRALTSMWEMLHQTSETHPWIIGSYIYFISPQTLVEMLKDDEKYKMTKHFDIDSMLYLIFKDWKSVNRRSQSQILDEAYLVKGFFSDVFEEILKTDFKSMTKESRADQKTVARNALNIILKVAGDFLGADRQQRNLAYLTSLTNYIAEWMHRLVDGGDNETRGDVSVVLQFVCEALSKLPSLHADEIKFVDSLLRIEWSDEYIQKMWMNQILTEVKRLLEKTWLDESGAFLEFYVKAIEKPGLVLRLKECIEKYAFHCLENLLKDLNTRKSSWTNLSLWHELSTPSLMQLFGKLFIKELDKVLQACDEKRVSDIMRSLHFITKWSFAHRFYQAFYRQKAMEDLPDGVQRKVHDIESNFRRAVEYFCSGKMSISETEFFLKNEKAIVGFFSILISKTSGADVSVDNLLVGSLAAKKDQLKLITSLKSQIETLISLCIRMEDVHIKVQIEELKELPLMNDGRLHSILQPSTPGDEKTGLDCGKFTDDDLQELEIIHSVCSGRTFEQIWRDVACHEGEGKHAGSGDELNMSWKEVLEKIWPSVKDMLCSVFQKIYDGSIPVSDFTNMFGFTDGDQSAIANELACLAAVNGGKGIDNLNAVLEKRCQQICKIIQLKRNEKTAGLLLNLKTALDLNGDFQSVEVIQDMEGNDEVALNDVNLDIGDNFTDKIWTDSGFLQLLEEFCMQNELITWLRKEMKDWSEVKVFCDLGMISAGETSYEVDRVSCLLSAVMGFAPLIFDLPADAGLKEVMEKCKAVQTNAESDDKLAEKWRDTGKKLAWFEGIHKFHGSDGTQSLTLAQDINKHGIYFISKPQQGVPTIESSLRQSLKMHQGEKEIVKVMTYDDLKDLQSKLMLIAGEAEQGQQDVARFNDVLSAAANLTQAYLNLIAGGCMLFNNWSARIICSIEELVISLNFCDGSQPISTRSCLKDLELLVAVMNEALEHWTEYIERMRLQHYYLNDYNIQQITYLCERLAKSDFTDQVYSLLSDLRRHQVCHHMQDALDEATEVYDEEEIVVEENLDDDAEATSPLEKKRCMVRKLAKNGLAENIAKAAVQCKENVDLEDCENWALIHQYDDDDLIEVLSNDFDEESGFGPETNTAQNFMSLLNNRTSATLKGLITQIQEKEQQIDAELKIDSIVKTICDSYNDKTSKLTLQDFLSIDHLGKFLKILREKLGGVGGRVDRALMPPMQKGKANLILVPSSDMLYTTLSLYMHNEKQPLPTRFEVLVCTERTSADEAGQFLRRAMLKNPRKEKRLFCMAFAEKLTFNVSAHVENLFNNLSAKESADLEYQLVILCSITNQQHYLVICFDRSRVELKVVTEKERLSRYICEKLKANSSCVPPGHDASVKLVTSKRSGVGKSLHVKRLMEKLDDNTHITTIRLLQEEIDVDHVLQRLFRNDGFLNEDAHLIHFDLTLAVQRGIEEFACNLFLLGSIQDSQGRVWRHHRQHFYAMEMTESKMLPTNSVLNLVPCTTCLSPKEVLRRYEAKQVENEDVILMDREEFQSETFQRPYQYLKRYDAKEDLDKFNYIEPAGSEAECITILLKHCGMQNPSWAQLCYFSGFLNVQLTNCEESIFCKKIKSADTRQDTIDFRGLKAFTVYFMIKMAQDFATPSLKISDESTKDASEDALKHYDIRRRWEDEVHPFMFFNEDRVTMTFINVNVNDRGDLLDANDRLKMSNMVSWRLVADLKRQGVPFGVKFNTLSREDKITILCQFMNIPRKFDPDPTYELTTDNVLKMLAIYMRLRCHIPVIVMGETGCGKTRMIEFMSKMRGGQNKKVQNMVTLKVHGGIKVTDIYESVQEAKRIAMRNTEEHELGTILFYDEANTTSAIHAIKEVVCDLTIDGEDFRDSQLQIVAACNPYKQLSDAAVKKLEESGLGYNIKASEAEQVGRIPMRRLVYRVVALPPSMQPFVWDFGQLGDETEEIYIRQMTNHLKTDLHLREEDADLINSVLFNAQCYMRKKCKNESRYVSLRDIERSLKAFKWFYEHSDHFFQEVVIYHKDRKNKSADHSQLLDLPCVLRCLIHTLSMCYHASLGDRKSFRQDVAQILRRRSIKLTESQINMEIVACQTVFASSLKMDDNIACNEALRENVFLMTICADLRIPLFVVGKPGSSKSLAKTIVADNMQGKTSHSDLYRHFKQVHILSYQCSALTDAKGIESIFNQCAQLQSNQDINSYAAVVVLDEVGLAEDSPNMPLKVLHPLLECGSTKNGTLTEFDAKKKVAFVGISNWALDPAKMNRGIFVTRNSPDGKDLRKTAEGIFENRKNTMIEHSQVIKALTDAYLQVCKDQRKEYFGLRDYYSLIKMLHATCKERHSILHTEVDNAIQRNFSGGEHDRMAIFYEKLKREALSKRLSVQEMVCQNLKDDKSRFLLLLTNQYSSFSLLQNFIPDFHKTVQVIFGSSFPNDHSYTEICRNINRVKVCMEAGRTVVLLNMTEINESLYDALNQHYVTLGGQRYVDLGLGGHRVKCRIADGFRLMVIELKEKVYNEYQIPLINRLEKHHLTSNSLLSDEEREMADELRDWVRKFSCIMKSQFTESDAFLGHNEDSVSSVVISHGKDLKTNKEVILESATTDAVFRLSKSELGSESGELLMVYVQDQFHDNLWRLLKSRLDHDDEKATVLIEITTFSNILSESDRLELESLLNTGPRSVMLLSLQQFQTEQDYLKKLDEFFNFCMKDLDQEPDGAVLLVQCPQAHKHVQLVACARYGLKNKLSQIDECKRRVVIALLLSTQRKLTTKNNGRDEKVLSLQHSPDCEIIYIDEPRPTFRSIGCTSHFHNKTICEVLEIGATNKEDGLGISMPTLLQDCICEAMTKIKSKGKEDRNLDCIKILSKLCCTDTDTDIGRNFLTVLTSKMVEIYREREDDDQVFGDNWIIAEACSAERLQEGGTFAKTLWLCLKSHVSHLLAYIVSIIDRDDNLDIIASEEGVCKKMHNMWLEMFKACRMRWEHMKSCKEFVMKEGLSSVVKQGLRIPFCAFIHQAFEDQWQIIEKEPNTDEEKKMIFLKHFVLSNRQMDSAIGNVLRLPSPLAVIKSYACDLIKTVCAIRHQLAEKLSGALEIISRQMLNDIREEELPDSVRLMLLFYGLKKHQRHFKIVNNVVCLCPDAEKSLDGWIKELDETGGFILHKRAIEYALQFGKEKALQIKDSETCIEWMNFTRRLGIIFNSAFDLINAPMDKQQLKRSWEPLAMLDMLLLHLLPNPSQQDAFKRYVEVVASHAKLLYKGTTKNGIRGQQFLRIVCNVLRKYFDDVNLRVTLSWQKKTCRICRKDCKLPSILPCGDYFCSACLENTFLTSEGQKRCFSCSRVLPEDFEALPATRTDAQEAEVNAFQANCTSFFLEYLNQFVFPKSDENPMVNEVFELIFEKLVLDCGFPKAELENAALSMNYATKSNIFSMMLRYNHAAVEKMLNRCLQDRRNDVQDIVFFVVKHFELVHIMESNNSRADEYARLEKCFRLLLNFQAKLNNTTQLSLEVLRSVAGVHYAISEYVKIISKNTTREDPLEHTHRDTLLCNMKNAILADNSEMLKEFFVKSGCQMIGMDWFTQVLNEEGSEMLIPNKLKDNAQMNVVDYFSSLDDGYYKIRSDFSKTNASKHAEKVKEWFPAGQSVPLEKLLAVLTWLHDHEQSKDIFKSQIALASTESAEMLDALFVVVAGVWPAVRRVARLSRQQISVLGQVVLASVGTVKSQTVMMDELKLLMTDPGKAVNLFWPAMPESFYFSMPKELRFENGVDAMYQCPNGHFYTIGNCTRPTTKSKCPDCHSSIGGVSYTGEAGNKRVKRMDECSQAGYKLISTEKNLQQPEDRIPMQSVSIMQILTHTCMLIGLQRNPNSATQVLPGIAPENVSTHLLERIQKNIQDFSNSIGRNLDEAILVIFKIFLDISKANPQGATVNWSSIDSRKNWEKQFRAVFLLPVFQNLDATINEAQQCLNAAEDVTSIALFRLVHEVKEEEEQKPITDRGNWWENQCLWRIVKHPNADHLTQCIRDHAELQTGSVLQTILETPGIELLQYLEDVLKLQQSAIERYQNKIDLSDAESCVLRDLLAEDSASTQRVAKYIKVWNKARIQVQSRGDCDKEMREWFNKEMTWDSPIATVVPSLRGRGRCAKILSEYLLEMHNNFLLKCFEIMGLKANENEVEVAHLLPSHFVVIDKQKDLLPLIYLHTSHTVEEGAYGRRHHISYNIDALEKQAREKFVKKGKVVIPESLPCIKYTQDVGIGSDWGKVLTRTKVQNPLSAKLIQSVDDLVLNVTPAEVCEGVRTLTHAISFLAKVECDHKRLLHEYLEKDLLLSKTRTAVIPRFAKIHHTLALYQHLTWHKAVNFVQQGLQPYKEALNEVPQEGITDKKVLKRIKEAFEHMDVILFQQRLNEMLIKVPDYNADWSLIENVFPFLEFIGDKEPDESWFDRIPEEVNFEHVSHLFELAVNHVQRVL